MEKKKKYSLPITLILVILSVIGFCWRIYGLNNNYSFWTDENHVAIFVRAILERGESSLANGYFTKDQQLQYWLSSISAKALGLNEFGVRFPSVLFGTLTILATYLLGSHLFNRRVGFFASLLTALSKIEILWSRQARPYQALQLFLILGAYFVYQQKLKTSDVSPRMKALNNQLNSFCCEAELRRNHGREPVELHRIAKEKQFNWRCFLGFLGCGIFASLMHGLGLVVFFSGFIYLLIFKTPWFKKKWIFSGIFLFLLFVWVFRVSIFTVFSQIGKIENLFYYRVFLTHNYLPLCLLAGLGGFLLIWRKNYQRLFLFVIFLGVQIIVISFFLGQPFTRYFYPVFPFVVLLASYGVWETGGLLQKKVLNTKCSIFNVQDIISFIFIFILLFSLYKSDKLSLSPQKAYSLNSDMQEVPEVDWKKIYGFVGQKLKENHEAVLVTNWNDLPVWYLGEGRLNYLVRETKVEKDSLSGADIVNSLDKFINLLKAHKKGFFVLDSWDNMIPDGIREYCHKNLKRELETDRLYPIQPRFWTVWVYSWGI